MDFQLPYCFCFLLLLLLPFSTYGQAYRNISLGGSPLTAGSDNLSWTSPSGDFSFGFQQVGGAGYLLAIWFNKIPERTIVWSANRNDQEYNLQQMAHSNISLGSSLTAATDNLPWTSPSGEFAFGFQQVGDAGYLLAIWFNKIPERTIVWSANRNDLVQGGSRVQLTRDGELVLNDQSGRQIWIRPESGGSGTAYAAMLDTGNFVVASQAGANLWQSFDVPTDTLLPSQNLNSGAQLIAPYLEKNYSDGRFKFSLQPDGNLILYTTRYPLTTSNFAYWSLTSLAICTLLLEMAPCLIRMQIAFDIARGLLYLHEECSSQIIHCDIKPQNILLDKSFSARISDFGLAKLLKTDQTKTTTAIRGTKGYVALEWFKNLPVTTKVDTYSFGILLLELVWCRKNFEINALQEHQVVLADWACDCLKEGKLDLLVEEDEEATEDMKTVERFVMVAIWCIQEEPSLRPGMKKVVQMLEGGVQVSVPPDPSSFISTI
ncbi:hypothetical protein POTOM_014670 [Populus tomentosa]|uniref:Bulb-type lectin domain-containing protein n=1 Tax=Populus tomentosa TaxID=118781 RepID=A0A8X8A895_POPTO|nr:hypothetical protein POTOM_014670 [Populus tomentosa]